MAKLQVSLNIGVHNAGQEDELDIDDDELASCATQKDREELMEQYWIDWSNNYIDGHYELIED